MNEFTWGGAWSYGIRFIARGTVVQFLILVLLGIAAPLGVQYAMVGTAFDAAAPMTAGPAMMQAMGVPMVLLAVALVHLLQCGSYFAALRFGHGGARDPVGAVGFGLAAGFIATLVVAVGYLVAYFGAQAMGRPTSVEAAVFMLVLLMLPLIVVYSLFFISQAILGAATIVSTLLFLFIYGAIQGYPELAASAFGGSGVITVIMLLLCVLLFWLAARFSCVTSLMAQHGNMNVFWAIGESWRLTSDEQWSITRYLALVGMAVAVIVIGVSLLVGAGMGSLTRGGLGLDSTTELVLRLAFGIPLAFLSVMLPAGIHQQLVGEDTPTEVFE